MRHSTFLTSTAKTLELDGDDDDTSKRTMTVGCTHSTSSDELAAPVPMATAESRMLYTALFMILFLGAVTSSAFIWFGVSTAQDEQVGEFSRAADDSTNKIQSAFEDYVNAAGTVHMRCRHRNFTRQDFRETYEYLIASGLQFKAVQFDPNITHAEREDAEAEARAYYAEHYPHVDYQGFRGFNYPNSTSLEPRLDRPFYFPIHYQEPILGNEAAIDLDYYSSESRTRAVDALFETKGPSLTDRLSLVKQAGSVSRCGNHNGPSYGVVLMHPGVPLSEPQAGDELWPHDFSTIVLCVPDLLARSTLDQSKTSVIYIHDLSHPSGDPVFMGGAKVEITGDAENPREITFLDEKPMSELTGKLMQQTNVEAANRVWTVTVLSQDDTYEPDLLFVCLGGAVVFSGSLFLAIWMYTNAQRTAKYNHMASTAARSTAIVSSLFPKNVAKQMMDYDANDRDGNNADIKSTPIADLFPATTVMFADMEGFTAWSSMRDPIAVFHLLETLYNAFDDIAARRNVFKVETVGDSYVAVCGLPEPRKDHAVVMARFAQDCSRAVKTVTRKLEVELGPETSSLDFRFGLHSGPVTGGVLRGQRARFQLFGDTVNTASRMESTSRKGKIQCSMATADILRSVGKGHWVVPREDKVLAKGIGVMQTCWLRVKAEPRGTNSASTGDIDSSERYQDHSSADASSGEWSDDKYAGTVDWLTESLAQYLKAVVTQQRRSGLAEDGEKVLISAEERILTLAKAPIEEMADNKITFPSIDNLEAVQEEAATVDLGENVMTQLRNFVWAIASSYKQVPFHNFEHASHVVMCVMKLLGSASNHKDDGLDDPLARFTLVLSAIIHDVDHPGVPNGQLNKEMDTVALMYENKSAAEQNSLDIAWTLLMKEDYRDLRRKIYKSKDELLRFRSLLVHTVLVTDIVNKDLQQQRKDRWNRVFGSGDDNNNAPKQETAPALGGIFSSSSGHGQQSEEDKKAERRVALLELVIQASDVSHTMQHWHIYRQWNTCLFHEMDCAWKAGRADSDPRDDWYKGEIGFFKFYILPLAELVKSSSAFGALGAELYHSAHSNLLEWEMKGETVVQELIEASDAEIV